MHKDKWIVSVLICLATFTAFGEDAKTETATEAKAETEIQETRLIGDIESGSKAGEVHVIREEKDPNQGGQD